MQVHLVVANDGEEQGTLQIGVETDRPINKGEQILVDYSGKYWSKMEDLDVDDLIPVCAQTHATHLYNTQSDIYVSFRLKREYYVHVRMVRTWTRI